jgi:hypothetical protein
MYIQREKEERERERERESARARESLIETKLKHLGMCAKLKQRLKRLHLLMYEALSY